MRKIFKKFGLTLLITVAGTTVVYADKLNAVIAENNQLIPAVMNTVDIKVNGEPLEDLTMPPVIYKDYTLVPVKEVFEALGATVIWNPTTQETYIIADNQVAILKKDSNILNLNAKDLNMPIAVKNINNKTMVPFGFIAQQMGLTVNWDGVNKVLSVDSPVETAAEQPVMPNAPEVSDTPSSPSVQPPQNSSSSQSTAVPPVSSSNQNGPVDMSAGVIRAMSYPTASITNIVTPASGGDLIFQIQAASEISSLKYFIQPDPYRLVIDVANASLDTPRTSYEVAGNAVCQSVRMSQYTVEPEKSSRIVFDLSVAAHYKVSLSPDRKTVTVQFMQNAINDVQFKTDGAADYVIITGQWAAEASLFPLSDPDRLVIDLPNALMNVAKNEYAGGIFTDAIRTGQFEEGTGRVVLGRKGHSSWSVSYEGNQTTVKITEPTYRNLDFAAASNRLAVRKTAGITASSIIETDDYSNRRYIITLPGDYSANYGRGDYYINSDKVSYVSIDNSTGNTRFLINERSIYAANITEDAEYVYVQMVNPKEKYDRVVLIDPGHGLADPGTSGYGMVEKDLNLNIALRIVQLFEADPSVKLYSTRLNDTYPTLEERAYLANEMADLFVSVHNNYFEENASAHGTEVFYYPHANDASIGFTSEQAADIVHNRIITDLGSYDRKVKPTKYVVLNLTEVPAMLCEIGFLSNYDEAMKLSTDAYRQKSAEAIAKGIREVFAAYTPRR